MIKKLKTRFVILATVSMLLLMTLLVGIMNAINYASVVSEADRTLNIIERLDAEHFDFQKKPDAPAEKPSEEMSSEETPPEDLSGEKPSGNPSGEKPSGKPPVDDRLHGMSPETPYESRFFTAQVSETGEITDINTSRIISIDDDEAEEYVKIVLENGSERGFIGQFRYLQKEQDGAITITFLDCGRKLDDFRKFLWTSALVGLLGVAAVFVIFLIVSGRIIRPIAESYVKQKRFITDAGHEIKTPLTIIGANLDLLEDDLGENESLSDIRQQTKRLTELTNNLVYLSRMEEEGRTLQRIEFPVSELTEEAAGDFRTLFASQGKDFSTDIQPSLSAVGSPDAFRQLISIFLENAMKYSPAGGKIKLSLAMRKKAIILSVYNQTSEEVKREDLEHIFDRFYRADASRNSSTGGYGIGLSIAQAIVTAHKGRLTAETKDGSDFLITASLPQ